MLLMRFIKPFSYILIGVANTILTYGAYLILLMVCSYKVSYSLSYALGVVFSYMINSKWTFKTEYSCKKCIQFSMVTGFQYTLSLCLLFLCVQELRCPVKLAPFVVLIVTVPIGYVLTHYFLSKN